jgi:hypothetical protein
MHMAIVVEVTLRASALSVEALSGLRPRRDALSIDAGGGTAGDA